MSVGPEMAMAPVCGLAEAQLSSAEGHPIIVLNFNEGIR